MVSIRRVLISLAATTCLAGGGIALAGDASAVAKAPDSWQCQHAEHYFGTGPDDPYYDSYRGYCTNAPASQKFAINITCKTGPGRYENAVGNWVYGRDGDYLYSVASCHLDLPSGRDGVFTGSYGYLGS